MNVLAIHEKLTQAGIAIIGVSQSSTLVKNSIIHKDIRIDFDHPPTTLEVDAASLVIDSIQPDELPEKDKAVQLAIDIAKTLNGKSITELTAGDKDKLLGLLLADRGWITSDLTISIKR